MDLSKVRDKNLLKSVVPTRPLPYPGSMKNRLFVSTLALLALSAPALAEEWHSADGRDSSRNRSSPDFLDTTALGKFRTVPNSLSVVGPVISSGRLISVLGDPASNDILTSDDLATGATLFSLRVGGNANPTIVHQLLAADDFVVAVANSVSTGNGFLRFIHPTTLAGTKALTLTAPIKNAVLHRHSVSQRLYLVLQVGNTEVRGFEITAAGFTQRWSVTIPSNTSITKPAIINNKAVFGFFSSGFPNNTVAIRTFDIETGATSLVDTTTSALTDSTSLGMVVDAKRNLVYFHSNRRIRAFNFTGTTPSLLWNKPFTGGDRRGGLAIADNGLVYTQTSANLLEIDPLAAGATTRSNFLGTSADGLGPAISDGLIWATSTLNGIVAQDLATLTTQRVINPAGTTLGNYFGIVGITDSNLVALSNLGVEQLRHARPIDLVQTIATNGQNALTQNVAELPTLFSQSFVDFGTVGGVFTTNTGDTPGPAVPLFRLLNPGTADRLYTTNVAEKNNAITAGFQPEADAGLAFSAAGRGRKPLTRLLNTTTSFHFVTGNSDDIAPLVSQGFTNEGIIGFVRTQQPSALHRLTLAGSDLLTVSQKETNDLVAVNVTDRGVIGRLFMSRGDSPDLVPLFELVNSANQDRLFTADVAEKASALTQGFFEKRRAGYVHTLPGAGRRALLRARDLGTGRHLYTTDPVEFATLGASFVKEGTAGFVQK